MSVRTEMRLADLILSRDTLQERLGSLWHRYEASIDRLAALDHLYHPESDPVSGPVTKGGVLSVTAKTRWIKERLRTVPKVVADNVADYVWHKGIGHPSELPALNPPFPEFWVETRIPASGNTYWVGALFLVNGDTERGWTYEVHGFQSDSGGEALADQMPLRFQVTPDGAGMKFDELWDASRALTKEGEESVEHDHRIGYVTLLAAISFLNCSNTQQVLVRRPLRDRKFGSTRGPKPLLTYRLIHVVAEQKVTKTQRWAEAGDDEGTALHICRGHFRTYTGDAPLFGKYVGTFWVPAHARGDAKHGLTIRDYVVHPEGRK